MNNIDKLTQKIFSKFNDNSLFFSNIYLTGTEENKAVVLFDMEGFILKVCLDKVKAEYTMPEDSYVLVYCCLPRKTQKVGNHGISRIKAG